MPLPNINIAFKTTAASAVQRSSKGIVGVILKDATQAVQGAHTLTNATQIPAALGATNKTYLTQAFIGYVNPPRKLVVYVLADDAADLSDALEYFETQFPIDYVVGPPDTNATEATEIASWIAAQRLNGFTPKAVLPNKAGDSEAVINFTTEGIKVSATDYTTVAFCARIAGLIAGTPMTISCTYAPLPEVTDITRLTKAEMDTAIDAGKFILFHDGEKVKVGRGVNSLTTTTADKGAAFKKIKIVEAVDMIKNDIRMTAQDNYIGKYANSYDNKCLLIMAIAGYFAQLENDGILQAGANSIGIDLAAQEAYLISQGVDTSAMTEQEIKEANTADKVYLSATIKILDAIEDVTLNIAI